MGIIWRSLNLKKSFLEKLWEKSTCNSFFAIQVHVIFVHHWHITHLWSIKNQNRMFYGFLLSLDTFSMLKKIFWNFSNFWLIWGLYGKNIQFEYTSQSSQLAGDRISGGAVARIIKSLKRRESLLIGYKYCAQ